MSALFWYVDYYKNQLNVFSVSGIVASRWGYVIDHEMKVGDAGFLYYVSCSKQTYCNCSVLILYYKKHKVYSKYYFAPVKAGFVDNMAILHKEENFVEFTIDTSKHCKINT